MTAPHNEWPNVPPPFPRSDAFDCVGDGVLSAEDGSQVHVEFANSGPNCRWVVNVQHFPDEDSYEAEPRDVVALRPEQARQLAQDILTAADEAEQRNREDQEFYREYATDQEPQS